MEDFYFGDLSFLGHSTDVGLSAKQWVFLWNIALLACQAYCPMFMLFARELLNLYCHERWRDVAEGSPKS
jgi:hypothetical protein